MGIELEELCTTVLALIDTDMPEGVRQAQFLKGDGDLESVRRTIGVEDQFRAIHLSRPAWLKLLCS
ncbi:hypothetical protein D3C76_1801820 [compost metagenome]